MKAGSKPNGRSRNKQAARLGIFIDSLLRGRKRPVKFYPTKRPRSGSLGWRLKVEMKDFFLAIVRCVNASMFVLLPKDKQHWGQALIAEQDEIDNCTELLGWAAGGLAMSVREFLASVFDNQLGWVFGSVLSLGAALLDLHSATRWPYLIAVCGIALLLTLFWPRWAWRWALLVALILPAFVLLSGEWGPYGTDQFDVFYGVLPAALGTLVGLGLRKAAGFLRSTSHSPVP
jgi:hypothetical protein